MKDLPPAFREIPSGADLLERIAEVFAKHRGWIQAVGFVEDAELKLPGAGADARRVFQGRFALAQLSGPLGGPYGVTLSRLAGENAEVVAGILTRAVSGGVSVLLLSAQLGVPVEGMPGQAVQVRPAIPPPRVPPSPAATSGFAARVGMTRPRPAPPDEENEPAQELPVPGDLVEHFAFGLCEVLKVEGDRLVLRDLRGHGRIREIASEKLAVSGPTEHDARRLFKLSRR